MFDIQTLVNSRGFSIAMPKRGDGIPFLFRSKREPVLCALNTLALLA